MDVTFSYKAVHVTVYIGSVWIVPVQTHGSSDYRPLDLCIPVTNQRIFNGFGRVM
jgi:hypothetical protein